MDLNSAWTLDAEDDVPTRAWNLVCGCCGKLLARAFWSDPVHNDRRRPLLAGRLVSGDEILGRFMHGSLKGFRGHRLSTEAPGRRTSTNGAVVTDRTMAYRGDVADRWVLRCGTRGCGAMPAVRADSLGAAMKRSRVPRSLLVGDGRYSVQRGRDL